MKSHLDKPVIESTPQVSTPSSLDQPADDCGEIRPSTLMLIGFAFVGKQCRGTHSEGAPYNPTAVCALGAMKFAFTGDARGDCLEARKLLYKSLPDGTFVSVLNDTG